ncbi:MAG: sigma-54-dependent Fis family transcriptional regulator [Blastocatellia bacterium]|nr:sigma-54-dependent Fis family transcriptional regulator [Blastocatellia bacterium]
MGRTLVGIQGKYDHDVSPPEQFSDHISQTRLSETGGTPQGLEGWAGSAASSVSPLEMGFQPTTNRFGTIEIIGQSASTRAMLDFIYKASVNSFSVLLEGESGTGKEVAAKAIHFASKRASGPFVAVNCGAINSNLIESDLFGHEKGAFTGAFTRKAGRFERANKGTLFLDEIGELSLQDQVKLLRAIQERRIERVGGMEEITVDVRIIAATNRDLLTEVGCGNFRLDLYYRLAVMRLIMSPLRDRTEDIMLLAHHFLKLHCDRLKRHVPNLTPDAQVALLRHYWPGNVRELENVIERALAHHQGSEINADSLVFDVKWKSQTAASVEHPYSEDRTKELIPVDVKFDDLGSREKRELIRLALQQSRGNRENAARLLGLSSRYRLHRLMKKFGIREGGDGE